MFNIGSLIKKPDRQVGGPDRQVGGPVKLPKRPSGGMVSYQTEGPPSAPAPVQQAPVNPAIAPPSRAMPPRGRLGIDPPPRGRLGIDPSRDIVPSTGSPIQRPMPHRYRDAISKFRM